MTNWEKDTRKPFPGAQYPPSKLLRKFIRNSAYEIFRSIGIIGTAGYFRDFQILQRISNEQIAISNSGVACGDKFCFIAVYYTFYNELLWEYHTFYNELLWEYHTFYNELLWEYYTFYDELFFKKISNEQLEISNSGCA